MHTHTHTEEPASAGVWGGNSSILQAESSLHEGQPFMGFPEENTSERSCVCISQFGLGYDAVTSSPRISMPDIHKGIGLHVQVAVLHVIFILVPL